MAHAVRLSSRGHFGNVYEKKARGNVKGGGVLGVGDLHYMFIGEQRAISMEEEVAGERRDVLDSDYTPVIELDMGILTEVEYRYGV